MSSKTIGAQRPFKVLVPALQGSTDPSKGPSGNPVYKWKTFEQQTLVEKPGPNRVIQSGKTPGLGNRSGILLTGSPPSPATGTIEVVGNTFVGPTSISIGAYTLVSGTDFQIGALVGNTAVNLAAAIDALPEYSAIAVGAVVTVSGQVLEITLFNAGGACPYNFSLTPDNGTLTGGDPHIGPPTLSL